jgi:ADP-heptose:LPS heptosyltransferase
MRILIVKLSSIGDIIKTYRAFYQIRFSYPQAHISWAVEDRYKDTVTHLRGLDDVIALPFKDAKKGSWTPLFQKLKELRKKQFDIVFDFHGNFKSAIVTGLTRAKTKIGYDRKSVAEWPNLLVTNLKISAPKYLPPDERSLLIVDALTNSKRAATPPLRLVLDKMEKNAIEEFVHQIGQNFLMICPFSAWDQKTLDISDWIRWIQMIRMDWGLKIVIPFFSEKEEIGARKIQSEFTHVHLWKIGSLNKWQYLMSFSKMVIAVDSASLHLAGVTNIPTFSIFGPTLDDVYRPIGDIHKSFQGSCPYNKTFNQKCKLLRTCAAPCLKKADLMVIHEQFNSHLLTCLNAAKATMQQIQSMSYV